MRNEEIFQGKRRCLIEFKREISFLNIALQISEVMDIPKDIFMILLKGFTIVYKTEIKSAHFFPQGRDKLNEKELAPLKEYMVKNNISKPPDLDKPRTKQGNKTYCQPLVKDVDLQDMIDPSICIYN
ncbi:hypothetical protein SUGI_1048160 [Cryptomeria japonica]|nr:hypothetical protein SUGI_1048160 [Cryptomeria japonica]